MSECWLQILGAGPWQLPLIHRAQDMGVRVLVVDRDAGRPGFALADRHALCDLMDVEGQCRLAREHGVHGVLQPTSDIGVTTAAAVAERLDLPGPGRLAARMTCDKQVLIEAARPVGLATRTCLSLRAGDPLPPWSGPCVVKPADNQSGRGVSRVLRPHDLEAAVSAAVAHSWAGTVLVDRWLDGDEYVVDALVQRGRLHLLGVARKRRDPDNPTVAVGIDYLIGLERDAAAARLVPPLQDLLAQARWGSSLLHAELIDSTAGPELIDLAARGGGALIMTHALPASLGIDVGEAAIRVAMGEVMDVPASPRQAVCIEFLRCPRGQFEAFEGLDALMRWPNVVAVHQAAATGDAVGVAIDKDARPGMVVCQGASLSEARAVAVQAVRSLRVRLQGHAEPLELL